MIDYARQPGGRLGSMEMAEPRPPDRLARFGSYLGVRPRATRSRYRPSPSTWGRGGGGGSWCGRKGGKSFEHEDNSKLEGLAGPLFWGRTGKRLRVNSVAKGASPGHTPNQLRRRKKRQRGGSSTQNLEPCHSYQSCQRPLAIATPTDARTATIITPTNTYPSH